MVSTGIPGVEMITWFDSGEVHPTEFVTVKVKTPAGSSVIVLLVPVPLVVISPGNLVKDHVPEDGKPLRTTLPVGTENVG
jgi:hypothetical protein